MYCWNLSVVWSENNKNNLFHFLISLQNRFQNNIITKNHQIRGKYALANFLSWKDSLNSLSKTQTMFKQAVFNLELSFFIAFFANIQKIKTKIKKINEAIFVLLIGQ